MFTGWHPFILNFGLKNPETIGYGRAWVPLVTYKKENNFHRKSEIYWE